MTQLQIMQQQMQNNTNKYKNTYCFQMLKNVKTCQNMSKEACLHVKRDLFTCQKRPITGLLSVKRLHLHVKRGRLNAKRGLLSSAYLKHGEKGRAKFAELVEGFAFSVRQVRKKTHAWRVCVYVCLCVW